MKKAALKHTLSSVLAMTSTFLFTNAYAHTPYLAPTSFEPVMGGMITLDASFAESFFIPEAGFDNSEFQVTGPDGKSKQPDSVVPLKTRVVVEHKLDQEGTYRVTTGARIGAEFYIYELNGEEKRAMNPKEPPPNEATIKTHFRSVTRADTYITHKKLNNTALKVEENGLQVLPITHPNELYAGEPINMKLLFDGKPLASGELLAYPAEGQGDPKALEYESNNKGLVQMILPAGKYLLRARYRAAAPKTAKVPTYSHTTTLSIQVFDNI